MFYGREVRIPVDLLVIGFTASDEVSTDVPTYLQKMNRMFERAYDMARMKFKSLHSDIGIIMRAKRMGNHSKLVTKYGYFKHTPAKVSQGNYPDHGKVPTQW